jgi:hypothetical protein
MYVDTLWAPLTEKLSSPNRFTLLFAPISRIYTESIPEKHTHIATDPFLLNKLKTPSSLDGVFSFLDDWQEKFWQGSNIAYEYHFWRHQYYDPSGLKLSKIINADVKGYLSNGVDGIIQDCSQRSFFPNGFAFYTYARTLFDCSLSYEELLEDYFSTAYGEDWKKFREYLTELSEVMDFRYLEGKKSMDPEIGIYYNPDEVKLLERVPEVCEKGLKLIREHYNSDVRVQTVSARLLELHAEFCSALTKPLIEKALGNDDRAKELYDEWRIEFGKREAYFQPFFDHTLIIYSFDRVFKHEASLSKRTQNDDVLADA